MPNNQPHHIIACMQLVMMAVNDQTLDSLFSVVERENALSSRRIKGATCQYDEWFLETVTNDECDRFEQLLGLVFVAAQTYISTVRSRIAKLSDCSKNNVGRSLSFVTTSKAYELLKIVDQVPKECMYTEIEMINAVANYWKHKEEWKTHVGPIGEFLERVWDVKQMTSIQKHTAEIVKSIGMSPSSTGNLRTACEVFGVASPYEDLSPLRDKLHNWGSLLQVKAQSEVETLAST